MFFVPAISLIVCVWLLVKSSKRLTTVGWMLAGWTGSLGVIAFLVVYGGLTPSSQTFATRLFRAILTFLGADPVAARQNAAQGNIGAAVADFWTLPSLAFAAVCGWIHVIKRSRTETR